MAVTRDKTMTPGARQLISEIQMIAQRAEAFNELEIMVVLLAVAAAATRGPGFAIRAAAALDPLVIDVAGWDPQWSQLIADLVSKEIR